MALFRRRSSREPEKKEDSLVDDFIYNEPDASLPPDEAKAVVSDTPEEAIRKMRRIGHAHEAKHAAGDSGLNRAAFPDNGKPPESPATPLSSEPEEPHRPRFSRRPHLPPLVRRIVLIAITAILVFFIGAYIFHRIIPDAPLLGEPEKWIGRIVTPVQTFFSGITETVADYFRTLKLRANLESEYNSLRAQNEQLVYQAMQAEELQKTLSKYEDMADEVSANVNMQPIICTVIGKSDDNYFSTFTINKGSNDGIEDYMAVTIDGALVGYTESVQPTKSSVRSIIDSEASIAALIQSSRDQGTVRGTLGIDGTPMCRMYYLPAENLPRPGDTVVTSGVGMSFPKGIPIGTIRESTRGIEGNKQYIVVEPLVDFQHLEYVIVLRYKPPAGIVEGRQNGTEVHLVALATPRPSPNVPQVALSLYEAGSAGVDTPTPEPEPEPEPTVSPSPTPSPTPVYVPDVPVFVYNTIHPHGETETATPTLTPEPTATPYVLPDPDDMTYEDG